MKLVEGTHYRRRLDQPSHNNYGSKDYVDCLLCGAPSDSDDDIVRRKLTRKQVNQDIRLDRLMIHYKGKHRDAFPSEGRSLLDLGFIDASAVGATSQVDDDAIPSEAKMGNDESVRLETVASRIRQPPPRPATTPPNPTAIAEIDMHAGQPFWRSLTRQVDTLIKANSTTQVIPSAHAIAMEVLRQ